eukprot:1145488-Pelagomonas_calceolata.AAC.5
MCKSVVVTQEVVYNSEAVSHAQCWMCQGVACLRPDTLLASASFYMFLVCSSLGPCAWTNSDT